MEGWKIVAKKETGEKPICQNKRARINYFIDETYEAGIALVGTEVKALRDGRANLKDSYALIKDGEIFIYDLHVSPYSHGNRQNHEPLRVRKLLMHRQEIKRLYGKSQERGLALIPLRMYFKQRQGQGGDRHRQRQEALRQAGRHQAQRGPQGHGAGHAGEEPRGMTAIHVIPDLTRDPA